jgi:RHS repeat-associated protein
LDGDVIVGTTTSYEVTNRHGDITGAVGQAGAFTASPPVDEFGVTTGAISTSRLGWLGAHERFVTAPSLGLIRMGVRLYDPTLGRFLEMDPVAGGSANDYDYASQDPVNIFDLDGRCGRVSNGHVLPCRGQRRYKAPRSSHGKPKKVRGRTAWIDNRGNVWEWARDKHGGEHWDVQHPGPGRRHTNVDEKGTVIGPDNFGHARASSNGGGFHVNMPSMPRLPHPPTWWPVAGAGGAILFAGAVALAF